MNLDLDQEIAKDYKKQAFLRDGGRCRYCDLDFMLSLSAFWSYTVDHLVAKSAGGEDTLDNIVTCCKACNGKKGSKSLKSSGMNLLKPAKKPRWSPELCLRLCDDDPRDWLNFFPKPKNLAS